VKVFERIRGLAVDTVPVFTFPSRIPSRDSGLGRLAAVIGPPDSVDATAAAPFLYVRDAGEVVRSSRRHVGNVSGLTSSRTAL